MDPKEFLLKAVDTHPKDLVSYVAEHFRVTSQAIHKHLDVLISDGLITKQGETRAVVYAITGLGRIKRDKPQIGLGQFLTSDPQAIEEHRVWNDHFASGFSMVPKNIVQVCEYGLTEILNNARDHAAASSVSVNAGIDGTTISIIVLDDGIGIFRKIKDALRLGTEREAILHLSKGKFTTDPEHHTGEGIFFSARSCDSFYISSGSLAFVCKTGSDWLLDTRPAKTMTGTSIIMKIDVFSKTSLRKVFDQYTVDLDVPSFQKTHVVVSLGLLADGSFISRSQAKRILLGLERFKEVLLDFKGLESIGPSFADEIFRVFQLQHPEIRLTPVNVTPDIDAAIRRAIANLNSTPVP